MCSPGAKDEGTTKEDRGALSNAEQASMCISLVARLNYLAPDRPDIAYSVKELARTMSKPTKGCQDKLKRLGRYLIDHPRLIIKYKWQAIPDVVKIYTDADWAGCKATRKSTSGGCLMFGDHCLKTWSKTQALTALSSGESEFYATLKASAEGLGLLSIMKDLGVHSRGQVFGDASAALGIINRKGLGRTRHIETGFLWVQETAAEKRLKFSKVLGLINPADLLTKYLPQETLLAHCKRLSVEFADGRAASAPKLNQVLMALFDYDFDQEEEHRDDPHEILMCKIQAKVEKVWYGKYRKHINRLAKGEQQTLKESSGCCFNCGLKTSGQCPFCSVQD